MIRYELPYPPSVNHYWRHAKIGKAIRVYVSKEGKAYREAVAAAVGVVETITTPVAVTIWLHAPTAHRTDIDNRVKAVLDALTYAGVWGDDSQVNELHVYRRQRIAGGLLKITIEDIE